MNQYDHIRKNLKDFNVPIDKDKLWANTAHAIPQKRKKRGAFFLLLGGALLISSAVTFYALSNSEKTIHTKTEIQSTSNQIVTTPTNQTINETNEATTESTVATVSPVKSRPELVANAKNITEKSNSQAFADKSTKPYSRSNTTKSMVTSQNTEAANVLDHSGTPKSQPFSTETRGNASTNDPEVIVTETLSCLLYTSRCV